MTTDEAVQRLEQLLPLKARQQALDPSWAALHRQVLHGFVEVGRPLTRDELSQRFPDVDVSSAVSRLAADDLVVIDSAEGEIAGAYPMTTEPTQHQVTVNGHDVFAMCAVDALAVGAIFDMPSVITSRCAYTGNPVQLHQKGVDILAARPSQDLCVGIRWQPPGQCAAHTLCREMVFLNDPRTGEQWAGQDPEVERDVFGLGQALELGRRFFQPLLME